MVIPRLGKIFTVGFGGWLIGYYQQKYYKNADIEPDFSILQPTWIIGNVSAASLMVTDEQNKLSPEDSNLSKHAQVKSRIQQVRYNILVFLVDFYINLLRRIHSGLIPKQRDNSILFFLFNGSR